MTQVMHLVKRALSSLSNKEPSDVSVARAILNAEEFYVWQSMQGRDQVHSLVVLQRFDALCPSAMQEERAAALLHDVGKTFADLGWCARVFASIVGPRGFRFRLYHDHENLGAQLLEGVSTARTIALVAGSATDEVMDALYAADQI
jgi:hypothetical protein